MGRPPPAALPAVAAGLSAATAGLWRRSPGWVRVLAKAALTVAATWLVLRGVGVQLSSAWSSIDWKLVQVRTPLLALSFAALAGSFLLTAWLWGRIVRWAGGPRVSLRLALALVLVSSLGRYVPGKVFQLATLAALAGRAGTPAVPAAIAAVGGQLLHLAGAALVGGAGIAWARAPAGWAVAATVAAAAGIGALLRLGAIDAALRWGLRRTGHDASPGRARPGAVLALLLAYAAAWVLLGLAFWLLARGTGLGVSLQVAVPAFAAAYAVGYLAFFAPAGIGVREGALAASLVPVLGEEASLTLAAVQRLWITAAEAAGGAWGAAALRRPSVREGRDDSGRSPR